MENISLRLILITIGVLLIAGIFLFGNPDRRKRKHASRKGQAATGDKARKSKPGRSRRADDELEQELKELGDLIAEDQRRLRSGEKAPDRPAKPKKPAGPPPDKIVTLYIRHSENRAITGVQLLDAAIKAGLEFGEFDIFHRLQDGTDKPLFSMANLVKPGSFDKTAWNAFETPGVTLFMTLPGVQDGLDIWDAMLATGQRVSKLLNAELLDDNQISLSRQRIAEIRESLREYDRKRAVKQGVS